MRKNIRLLSILFVFISVFFVSGVQADTKDITIDSISVNKRNGQVQVDNLTLGDNKLTSKIVFNKVDDYVHFKVKLNNSSSDNYKIISISDNNKNNNISISYEYSKDYFKKNADVIVKIKYEKQLNGVEKISLNDLTITFSLEREDGAQSQIVVNPTTNDSILHYLVLLIISLAGIVIVVIKKKKKIGTFLLVFATILIPFAAIANERFEVKLKLTNIDIIGKVDSPIVEPEPEPEPIPEVYALLVSGDIFNPKLSEEATTFRKATEEEYNSVKDNLTEDNIISIEESPEIVYMWQDGQNMIYYSVTDVIYMNEDSSNMFKESNLTNIDLSGLNSSRTINMSGMFKDSIELLEVNLNSLNTKNVTDMSEMFYGCKKIVELDLLNFNTEKVTDMSNMFGDCWRLEELDLSSFDTRSLADANGMFMYCSSVKTIYVSNKWVDRTVRIAAGFTDPEEYPFCTEDKPECEGNEIANNMFSDNSFLVGEMGTTLSDCTVYYNSSCARPDRGPYKRGLFTLKGTMDIAIFVEGPDFNEKLLTYTTEGKSFREATEEEYNAIKDNLTEDYIVSLSKITPIYLWETNDNILYYSEAEYIYFNPDSSYMFANSSLLNIDVSMIDGSLAKDMSYMFLNDTSLTNINFGEDIESTQNSGSAYNSGNKVAADILSVTNSSKTNMIIILIPILITIICTGIYVLAKKIKSNKTNLTVGAVILILVISSLAIAFATFGLNKLLAYVGPENGKNDATLGHFSTEKVDNFNGMFKGCTSLRELDLSTFVVTGERYLYDNYSLAIDIEDMFSDCVNLETIYVSDKWENEISTGSGYHGILQGVTVFSNCRNLVGEKGTAYSETHYEYYVAESAYARIDGGTYAESGFFTKKGHEKTMPREATLGSPNNWKIGYDNGYNLITTSTFRKATEEEYNAVKDELNEWNLISLSSSPNVYFWTLDSDETVYYSKAEKIYMSEDSSSMFADLDFETIDLSGIDTSRVKDMSYMFSNNDNLVELDISGFDTSNVENMSYMFADCPNLETIYVSDSWDTSKVTNFENMFYYDYSLVGGSGTFFADDYEDYRYAHVDGGSSNPGYLSHISNKKDFSTLINGQNIMYRIQGMSDIKYFRKATLAEYNEAKPNLNEYDIISVSTSPSLSVYLWQSDEYVLYYSKASKIYMNEDSSYMFAGTYLESIDLSGLDSSNVEDMSYMFDDCEYLTSINFGSNSNLETSMINGNNLSASVLNATNNNYLFIIIPILFIIIGIGVYIILKTVKIKGTTITAGTIILVLVVSSIVISIGTIGLNKLLASVNQDNETNNQTSGFNTSNVTNMSYMFSGCKSLTSIDLSSFDTSKVTDMDNMFYECELLTVLDLSSFDVSSLESANRMFADCESLGVIYVSDDWLNDTELQSGEGLQGDSMFLNCFSILGGKGTTYLYESTGREMAHIDDAPSNPGYFTLVGHGMDSSTTMLLPGETFNRKFKEILGVPDGSELAVEYGVNFRRATQAEYDSVKDSLTANDSLSLPAFPSKFYIWNQSGDTVYYTTANTIYMNANSNSMFSGMEFETMDLSGFDTSFVTNMSHMFSGCLHLRLVDVSSFDTSNVTDMSYMFSINDHVVLDLSSFDTSNVTSINGMFSDNSSLRTIYVSNLWDTSQISSDYVFEYDNELVGGAGTQCEYGAYSSDYAHIDVGLDNPGYFTDVRYKQ